MASVKPAAGETIVREVRTRVETPPAPGAKDPALPSQSEFMNWIQIQPEAVWEERELTVRLYRGAEKVFLAKIIRPPFTYEWIQQTYGGGEYKILAFEGPQLRWNVIIEIFGRPKEPDEVQPAANATPATGEVGLMRELVTMLRDELRAARGGDTATEAVRQAVALNGEVFRGAVSTVNGVLHPPTTAPVEDEFTKALKGAMLQKLLNPTDPIDTFVKMLTAMQTIPGLSGSNNGTGNMVTDAIRALPAVMNGLTNITANMARAKEIEIRGFIEARNAGIPIPLPGAPPQPVAAAPPLRPAPAPQPQPSAPAPGQFLQPQDGFEFIESGIVNILMLDPSRCVDDCADQALKYLDAQVPDWVDQMIQGGEDGVLKLFRERRILQQVPQNPRLTEFVKKFLEFARESREPEPIGAAPPPANVAEVLEPQPTA